MKFKKWFESHVMAPNYSIDYFVNRAEEISDEMEEIKKRAREKEEELGKKEKEIVVKDDDEENGEGEEKTWKSLMQKAKEKQKEDKDSSED